MQFNVLHAFVYFTLVSSYFMKYVQLQEMRDSCSQKFEILLYRDSRNSGFHREVLSTYVVRTPQRAKDHDLLIVEHLPAGLFIDPYEVFHLMEFGGPKIYILDSVDVESPAYDSSTLTVYIYVHVGDETVNITFPVHLRYHKPHQCLERGEFVTMTVPVPDVYMKKGSGVSDTLFCTSLYPCDENNLKNCSWMPVSIINEAQDLEFLVPVGCSEMLSIVSSVTFVVVIGGAILLVITLFQKSHTEHKTHHKRH